MALLLKRELVIMKAEKFTVRLDRRKILQMIFSFLKALHLLAVNIWVQNQKKEKKGKSWRVKQKHVFHFESE